MSILDYFKSDKKSPSAATAKERLQIIVAHQRTERDAPDYFPRMKNEILEVIRKYVSVDEENVSVQFEQKDENLSVLELNVTLPESA